MNDQASKLRTMKKNNSRLEMPNSVRVIAVTSGKGGVGKTNLAVNLSIALQKMGKNILLVDADLGLANVDLLIGMAPEFNLFHVLNGQKSISEVIVNGPGGIRIIPGASGLYSLANLPENEIDVLIKAFSSINVPFDFMVIDTGAGISKNVINFVRASEEVIVITTPEHTALADAYAVIKLVHDDVRRIHIVVNKADNYKVAEMTAQKLSNAAEKFLNTSLNYLGFILEDRVVLRANMEQVPFFVKYPDSLASKCISNIAGKLLAGETEIESNIQNVGGWLRKLLSYMLK